MTTLETNRRTIVEFFRRSQDGEDVMPMLADDVKWWVPGDWELGGSYAKTELAQVFDTVFAALDGRPRFTLHALTAEGDRVAVEASSTGRFKDGGSFGNSYHFLFRLRDGLIMEAKEYMDTAYMARLVRDRPDLLGGG